MYKRDLKVSVDNDTPEERPHYQDDIFFRMYPVVIGNGRNLQSDAVIGGYNVPKGVRHFISFCPPIEYTNLTFPQTHVIFPHLVVSNLKEYFPEPEKFLPERWIKRGEIGKIQKIDHFSQLAKCVQLFRSS